MVTSSDILRVSLVLVLMFFQDTTRAEPEDKIQVLTEWTEDEQPIRVDCHNLGMTGDGIGGEHLSCSDRLSLYATFSCFPMKKAAVEATCPEWEGLEVAIDWERVAELIDARAAERAAEEERKKRVFDLMVSEDDERVESDR